MNAFKLAFYGRSPLNIVHAGLDIIRADMRPMDEGSSLVVVSTENAEMIEQIFTASQTAIDILDDLLQYEHIDSGRQTICGWMNVYFKQLLQSQAPSLSIARGIRLQTFY